jgi:hypothetical protein
MLKKIFISTLLATSFISTSNANVTIINNGNNPVLWGNAGEVTNLISAIPPNNTNNKNILDGEYIIKDKFNPDRYCSFQVDNGKIKKSSLNNLQGLKPKYNKRPTGSSLPKQLTLFSCDISSDDQTISINPPTSPRVTGYTEVTDDKVSVYRDFAGIGDYSINNKTFFDLGVIFSAVFDSKTGNITFNKMVDRAITQNKNEKSLQKLGIPTLLSITGDHGPYGWSCFTSLEAVKNSAQQIVSLVKEYNLDGIVIDDEYTTCARNPNSVAMIAKAIKTTPGWNGRVLTKALFTDLNSFSAIVTDPLTKEQYSLGDYLDFGSEMSYGSSDFNDRLTKYTPYLKNNQIQLGMLNGGSTFNTDPKGICQAVNTGKNYGGIMIFDAVGPNSKYIDDGFKSFIKTTMSDYSSGC